MFLQMRIYGKMYLSAVVLKKPVLLKGPSGSGKTKLAQTISHFFNQPMQSVNCSVDLDAESLLGFKTIIRKMEKRLLNLSKVQLFKQ